jgi:acyl transferase domain-containing protein/acyl carrier protein
MRQTVRFADGVEELLKDPEAILLEVGPGLTLKNLARWHPDKRPDQLIVSSIPSPRERQKDIPYLLKSLGQLWLAGVEPDWAAFTANEQRMRVPLPTYPFERQRYWVDLDLRSNQLGARKPSNKRLELDNWFSVPAWKETPRLPVNGNHKPTDKGILVFADRFGLTSRFLELIKEKHQHVISVAQGPAFRKHDEATMELNPECPEDYDALFQELSSRNLKPETIVNFWNVTPDISAKLDDLAGLGERGFFDLLYLAQSIGRAGITDPLKLVLVSNGIRQVTGAEELHPEKSIVLGPCQVFPREYPNVSCQSIDITVPAQGSRQEQWLAEQILAELSAPKTEPIVAYRDHRRWLQRFEPVTLHAGHSAVLRDGGVYLITGGLGGLGLEVAAYLAPTCRARLVLVSRSAFPAKEQWPEWIETHGAEDRVSKTIGRILQMEESGSEVLVLSADVADEQAMRDVFAHMRESFNELNGVIHAAGIPAGGLMQIKKSESAREVFAAKVKGTRVIEKLVEDIPLDFFVLFSSLSSIVGRLGQVDYVGANAFLDLFAQHYRARTGRFAVSIDWSAWEQVGMAAHLFREPQVDSASDATEDLEIYKGRISPADGVEAFDRILAAQLGSQVIVSPQDLQVTLEQAAKASGERFLNAIKAQQKTDVVATNIRQHSDYVPPASDAERRITLIWQDVLGLEDVGVHDNFFDLGGSSLFAIQVLSRLRKEFNVEIQPAMIFEGATISALAKLLTKDQGEKPEFKEEQSRGERRKSKAQERLKGKAHTVS